MKCVHTGCKVHNLFDGKTYVTDLFIGIDSNAYSNSCRPISINTTPHVTVTSIDDHESGGNILVNPSFSKQGLEYIESQLAYFDECDLSYILIDKFISIHK